jgi:dipeptidyl aminopeptidase/acylaminoacyl peptidase
MAFAWTPEQIVHYPLIEEVHLAPDGRRLLFTVRTAYLTDEASEFRPQVMLAAVGGEHEPHRLTFGEAASQPRWSPTGQHLAFLRKSPGADGKIGLWVMAADGGEAWPLTSPANGVRHPITRFAWSPDGKQLAFLCTTWDEAKEKRRKGRDDVLHWSVDYDFTHLHVMDFATAAGQPGVRQLTSGRLHVLNLAWSPDGARLAITHRPTPLLDSWTAGRLAIVPSDGSAPLVDLGPATNWQGELAFSPDGQWIATDVSADGHGWAYAGRLTLFPSQGGQPITLADVSDGQPDALGWAPDGRAVYVLNQQGLASQVLALPVDGGPPQICVESGHAFEIVHINHLGQAVLVMQNFDEVNSVYVADLTQKAAPRKVAEPSTPAYGRGPLPQVRTLRWRTPDGFEIEGILYLPADYMEGGAHKLPLLLHVHGGPMGVFQRQFVGHPYYYTPAALCERGIAVLRCNPRGSSGYGAAFRFANRRDWGGGDYRDLQQGVDTVIEQGIGDPARLGICGWSYGGYMTSWAITQSHRFCAASIGAAVTNPMSFNATADIPGFIPDYFGAEAWEDLAFYQAHSPIFHVQQVQTPAIIQHGDADPRVPLEQGLQFYNALKRRGLPVEMYIYPRQGHALNEPRLMADALQRNLDWFTKKLVQGE